MFSQDSPIRFSLYFVGPSSHRASSRVKQVWERFACGPACVIDQGKDRNRLAWLWNEPLYWLCWRELQVVVLRILAGVSCLTLARQQVLTEHWFTLDCGESVVNVYCWARRSGLVAEVLVLKTDRHCTGRCVHLGSESSEEDPPLCLSPSLYIWLYNK